MAASENTAADLPPPACGDGSCSSSSRKRKWNDDHIVEVVQRMSEKGMDTSVMASVLDVAEQDILNALVKRGRSDDANAAGSGGVDQVANSERGEIAVSLMDRLLEDPPKLSCPVSHALMEDPVVAEDGFTYEREVISTALEMRAKSPTTNETMGPKLVPNQILKTEIVEFKDNVVREVLSISPQLPSGDAARLLRRAEDFVRPKLPDAAATKKLIDILKQRARLPAASRGSATKDLAELLSGASGCSRAAELLDHFDDYAVQSHLQSFGVQTVEKLFHAAIAKEFAAAIQVAVGREYARRIVQADAEFSLRRLWEVVLPLSKVEGECTDIAAVVLARWGNDTGIQLKGVPIAALERSLEYVDDPELARGTARAFFDTEFSAVDAVGQQSVKAALLLELAGRQADGQEACRLLVLARKADQSHTAVRKRLIDVLSGMITTEHQVDEALLITLLWEERQPMPDEVLSCCRLDAEQLGQVPSAGLLALAEQLNAQCRGQDGASCAVLAAKAQEAAGDHTGASKTYIRAYNMDSSNTAASRGVVAMAGAVSDRCTQLEHIAEELKKNCAECTRRCATLETKVAGINQQMWSSVEWDVQELSFGRTEPQEHISPKFILGGILTARLKFYPRGLAQAADGWCSLFLELEQAASCVDITLAVDDVSERLKENADGRGRGFFMIAPRKDSYSVIRVDIHEISLMRDGLKLLWSKQLTTASGQLRAAAPPLPRLRRAAATSAVLSSDSD